VNDKTTKALKVDDRLFVPGFYDLFVKLLMFNDLMDQIMTK